MKQEILYREAAREMLLSGVNKLADVVASTLGPSGHNVILNLEKSIKNHSTTTTHEIHFKTIYLFTSTA